MKVIRVFQLGNVRYKRGDSFTGGTKEQQEALLRKGYLSKKPSAPKKSTKTNIDKKGEQ